MAELARIIEVLNVDQLMEDLDLEKNEIIQSRDIDGKIHPSSLGGCGRKIWYALLAEPPQHSISARLRKTFEHGHKVHEWIQEKLDKALGKNPHVKKVEIEKSINDTQVAYDFLLAGNADGLITLEVDGEIIKIVYEIKTINKDGWEDLRAPLSKHVIQTTTYAKCFDAYLILFDYFNKNDDCHKRYFVRPSEVAWHTTSGQITNILKHLAEGTEPARAGSSWECKGCSYYHICRPELHRSKE